MLQYFVYSEDLHIGPEESVWAHKTIFTLWTAPAISMSFKPLPNSTYLDASEVQTYSFCPVSKKGRQNIRFWSNMRPFLHRARGVCSSLLLDMGDRVKNGKRQSSIPMAEAHLLALPVSLQLSYLPCEMNFPAEKIGRDRPMCSGEILHKRFPLLKGSSEA